MDQVEFLPDQKTISSQAETHTPLALVRDQEEEADKLQYLRAENLFCMLRLPRQLTIW
jgi:hypothetical protein